MRRLLTEQRGFAVPTVLVAVIIGLLLAGAAITGSIYAQRGSTRDQDSKQALAAADAGIQVAIWRQNKIVTSDLLRCVVVQGTGDLGLVLPLNDGWCPQQTGTVDGRSFAYRVKPWALVGTAQSGLKRRLEIVSVGTSDGVTRRLAVTASTRDGAGVFGTTSMIGVDQITIGGSSDLGELGAVITNAGTNGDIVVENNGTLCGEGHVGVGRSISFEGNGSQCPGFAQVEEALSLPPVDPGNVWDANSNSRICSVPIPQDTVTPSNACGSGGTNAVLWDATARSLTLRGSATLTLGGSNYSFCHLQMEGNSQLIVAEGAIVNIFFHSPETCGQTGNPVTQLDVTGNARIRTTSLNPGDLHLLFVGSTSGSIPTAVNMTGNSRVTNEFTLYGPRTDVNITGNAVYVGAIAGKTLTAGGSAALLADDRASTANLPISLVYQRERYVECTGGALPSPPDSAC